MEQETNNKMVLQSYKLTAIRNDFGIYAQRLIVRIAEQMQYRLKDADFTRLDFKYNDPKLTWHFKVADLMQPEDQNYTAVKRELHKAIKASVFYEDKYGWQESIIFTDIKATVAGEIEVKINDTLWGLFLEFSKGFKRYKLESAMRLKSTYALRLYQLISENQNPITYSIDWLKQMFQIQNKYKGKPRNFIDFVIKPAQAEINNICPTNFYWTPVYTKTKGRPTITAITFHTYERKEKANIDESQRKYSLGIIPTQIKDILISYYGFSESGIKANARLLAQAYERFKEPSLEDFLRKKLRDASKAGNPLGWIINAIKAEMNPNG